MHYHELARVLHEERQREIERRLRHRIERAPRSPWRLRLAVGRLLIRIGSAIAAEAQHKSARVSRPVGDLT